MMNRTSSLNGKSILIVDDEPELRKAITFEFKRRGCKVLEASSGNEAIKIAQETKIDAIVSDVRMPDGTGIELLESVRRNHPRLPIVLLITGFADITEAEALHKGAYALLDKPIDRKQMIALVEKSLFSERDN